MGPMTMAVDMRGIKTVLGRHTPVALDLIAHNRMRHQVVVPEAWLPDLPWISTGPLSPIQTKMT